jgi:hypothetical protein
MPEYGGVHMFLFIPWEADPDPASQIAAILQKKGPPNREGPLHFAALCEEGSDFAGFAHFSTDNASDVGDLIGAELWNIGIRSDTEIEGKVYRDGTNLAAGVKRRSPQFVAVCRIRVQGRRPLDVLDEVGDRYDGKPPFGGGSQLLRRNQILIELVADDRDPLDEAVAALRDMNLGPMRVGTIDTGATAA